jgi:hypothetical protein
MQRNKQSESGKYQVEYVNSMKSWLGAGLSQPGAVSLILAMSPYGTGVIGREAYATASTMSGSACSLQHTVMRCISPPAKYTEAAAAAATCAVHHKASPKLTWGP